MPKEGGWSIPPQLTKRIGVMPKTKVVQQTEDILVNTCGNIYIADKQWTSSSSATPARANPPRRPSSKSPRVVIPSGARNLSSIQPY
jgi:hypothetical protein